jgi:hypothetical protein
MFNTTNPKITQILLRSRLEELKALKAAGFHVGHRIEIVQAMLRSSAPPKRLSKERPTLADFDRAADKWGNA